MLLLLLQRRELDPLPVEQRGAADQRPDRVADVRAGQDRDGEGLPGTVPTIPCRQHTVRKRQDSISLGWALRGKGKGNKNRNRNIPVQRNRHRAQPRAHARPQRPSPHGIRGAIDGPDLAPHGAVDAVHVDERRGRQEGHVARAEEGVRVVRGQRRAEEDEEDEEDGGGKEGCEG